jgi:hypothetical protein
MRERLQIDANRLKPAPAETLEVPLFETRFLKVAPQRVVSDDVDPATHALDLIPRIDRNKAGRLCPSYTRDQAGERQQSIGSRNHIAALGVLLTEFQLRQRDYLTHSGREALARTELPDLE